MVTPAEHPQIEAMWVVHLMLTLAALYAVVSTGMFFAQTWLLFPTMFAGAAGVQLPASTQRLEVRTTDGESLAGVRIPSQGATADTAPTLLGFGGGRPSARALFSDSLMIFDHLVRTQAGERIIPVGFSIGAAV